jgi:azobenzene reductase
MTTAMTNKPKVLLIAGTVHRPSATRALLRVIAECLAGRGAEPFEWDLVTHPLPIADPEFDGIPLQHPNKNVREFARRANEANAFVLGSPNYHNSYTGVLKNALDSLGDDQFGGKPIGLVAHKGVQPLDHLRIVVRGVGAYAITRQVITTKNDFVTTPEGYMLQSETLAHRIPVFCDELLDWVARFQR